MEKNEKDNKSTTHGTKKVDETAFKKAAATRRLRNKGKETQHVIFLAFIILLMIFRPQNHT